MPDIGREVVAAESDSCPEHEYTATESTDSEYDDTMVGEEEGGVACDAVYYQSNPDYTGMGLLERRSRHPDFTRGIKPQGQGMFAVVVHARK